jgi:hypothetical protein
MNARFIAAAVAIGEHFKKAEVRRGEPYPATFINPMQNDAVTPNAVGVPVTLLRALADAQDKPEGTPAYAPLSRKEISALVCMIWGAPVSETELLGVIVPVVRKLEKLQARNERPVDPATLPRKRKVARQ